MSRRRYEIKKFRALLETSSDQKMDGEFVFEQKECVAFWREISAGLRFVWPINCQVSKLAETTARSHL